MCVYSIHIHCLYTHVQTVHVHVQSVHVHVYVYVRYRYIVHVIIMTHTHLFVQIDMYRFLVEHRTCIETMCGGYEAHKVLNLVSCLKSFMSSVLW